MIRRGYLIFTQGFALETHKIGLWLYCCLAKQAVQIYYMKQTGHDIPSLYKETSSGGLAKILDPKASRNE